jgi:hypothetical protein
MLHNILYQLHSVQTLTTVTQYTVPNALSSNPHYSYTIYCTRCNQFKSTPRLHNTLYHLHSVQTLIIHFLHIYTWSKAWVCSRSLAGIVGSNPAWGMDVCRQCCVLSGRGLCVGPITRPEESYRVWCVAGNYSQPAGPYTHTAGSKLRSQTPTKHTTRYLWITTNNFSQAQHSLMMDHIRSETCRSDFFFFYFLSFKLLYNVDFNI